MHREVVRDHATQLSSEMSLACALHNFPIDYHEINCDTQLARAAPAKRVERNDRLGITITFWGVRGSTPTPGELHAGVGGNTPCLEIQISGEETLILDAGTGARALGAKLMEQAKGRELSLSVLLTHFHWDHIQGIPFFQPLFSELTHIKFYSAASPAEAAARLHGQMTPPYFSIDFDSVPATCTFLQIDRNVREIGGSRVISFPLHHPQGCNGYRIERDGHSIVFATDFEHGDPVHDGMLMDAAAGADVLILDAQYTPEEYETRRGWGHSDWMAATRIARAAGVKELVLFHHDPTHDDAAMRRILQHARAQFPATRIAIEGEQIQLG